MATTASGEEWVVEIVPAAPDPKERVVPSGYDYHTSAARAANINEALCMLQPLRARISQLLGPATDTRCVGLSTDDYGRRCLAFLETEMSITAAFLTTTPSLEHYLDVGTVTWLQQYRLLAIKSAYSVLAEVDPSSHSLLRRASQCFHGRKSYSHSLPLDTLKYYYFNEHPSRYTHLLLTSSNLGIVAPHQLTEEDAFTLVDIDRPAKKIFRWLAHQGKMDMNTRVMSIVGPVGIGKTTLAVELRNRLRQHQTSGGRYYFQCNVMAQASRGADWNILLLQDILSQVSEPAATTLLSDQSQAIPKTIEVLVRLVSEHLQDKRYFVIIDDIWKRFGWETIKGAFPNNNLDSRILITTHSTSIAWECCSGSYDGLVHQIEPLSEVDSERLLLAKAVGSMDGYLPNNMKLHRDEILRRCDGIPLFINGMADRLNKQGLQQLHQRDNEDKEHKRFARHYLEQVPGLPERLQQALSSAFNDFPDGELLLSISMFPSGYKVEKDRLIWKLLQEGLSESSAGYWEHRIDRHGYLEAERFFSTLVDRKVITCVALNCKHKQDEVDACRWQVNHFLQQFLASKSAEMGFLYTTANLNLLMAALAATGHASETRSRMPPRLALHHPDPRLPSLLETMDLSQTRSLAVSGAVSGIPLEKFVNLVALDLEGWENLKDKELLQICRSKMIFLSYLNIRNTRVSKLPHEIQELRTLRGLDVSYTQITELPHEIKELRTLKTLDISYTQISELPLELFQLTYLEHLDLRGTQIGQLPKQIVGLQYLTQILVGGEGTINSVETTTRLPHDVWRLFQLRTLATVDLTQHPASFVRALGDLRELRVLAVTWSFHQSTDRDYSEALKSSIVKWTSHDLKSLTIHCGLGCSMEFLASLEKVSRPYVWLKKFKVTGGRFASVPQWIDGFGNLAFLQITVCDKQTTTHDLKILGALPKLQCLILGLDFIPGQPIVIGNEAFCELQRLSVDCPMPWLNFSTGAMPKLTYLQLKFSSTPASEICVPLGISNLYRITEVALCYNAHYINSPSVKLIVEAVTKQVAEHHNPIDLFINGIQQDDVQEADEVTEITIGTSCSTNDEAEDDAQAVGEDATTVIECEITEADS